MRHQSAITALALLKFRHGLEQVHAAEIGPQRRRDVNFRVCELPQQEITESHFAAGTNHEIGVGEIRRVEMFSNRLFIDQVSIGRRRPSRNWSCRAQS